MDEICEWLEDRGFAESVLRTFRGTLKEHVNNCRSLCCVLYVEQDMDGNSIAMGLGPTPGPDWLRDIIPVRIKVHYALRTLYNANMVSFGKKFSYEVD